MSRGAVCFCDECWQSTVLAFFFMIISQWNFIVLWNKSVTLWTKRMLLSIEVYTSYIMENFRHEPQSIEHLMYSAELLPVKTEGAVFTCDVCVRFNNGGVCSSFIQQLRCVFLFLPTRCRTKRDRDLGSRWLARKAVYVQVSCNCLTA
jgi:hypothetical protein